MLITLAALAVGVVIVGFAVLSQPKTATSPDAALVTPGVLTPSTVASSGRTLGDAAAPATIDLYGDFRCSACYYFTELGTEKQVVDAVVATGKARIVWHDFLTIDRADGATASRDAANAAWCGADQGKFWTMHDWLYANQSSTEAPSAFTKVRLAEIGKAAGLDMTAYQACLDNGTHDADIAKEDSSVPAAVSGTPTVIVNGTLVGAGGQVPTAAQIIAAVNAVTGSGSSSPAPSTSPSG
jgi:protein-disulfide isomerase